MSSTDSTVTVPVQAPLTPEEQEKETKRKTDCIAKCDKKPAGLFGFLGLGGGKKGKKSSKKSKKVKKSKKSSKKGKKSSRRKTTRK